MKTRVGQFTASALWILLVSACSTTPQRPQSALARATPGCHFKNDSYWIGDRMEGAPSVRISLAEQQAYFYKGGHIAGVSHISTGRIGSDTVTGNFHILQKDKDHKSSLYGNYVDADGKLLEASVDITKDPLPQGAHLDGARMPNFMRITNGTGMHEGYLPGYADSHGCIRLPGWMAEWFFDSVTVGTPVSIER